MKLAEGHCKLDAHNYLVLCRPRSGIPSITDRQFDRLVVVILYKKPFEYTDQQLEDSRQICYQYGDDGNTNDGRNFSKL